MSGKGFQYGFIYTRCNLKIDTLSILQLEGSQNSWKISMECFVIINT